MLLKARQPEQASSPLAWACFEITWIVLLFFLFAGSPPPDAGESCYLQKAKHYWDPTWCGRDLFLASADAHAVLYWMMGWLTKYFSLEATAWICRIPIWIFMAWGWRRMSNAIVPGKMVAILTAGLFLLFSRWFPMAREVAVCGVESKAIAFGCVFSMIACMARDRWSGAWIWVGVASAMHVVIGAWSAIILGSIWIAMGNARPRLLLMVPGILCGAILSLPGLVPALLLRQGVDAATIAEADRIYVYERLRHHLVFHSFENIAAGGNPLIERFGILCVCMALLLAVTWDKTPLRAAYRFALGALAVSTVGVLIDQLLVYHLELAAPILRLYWYRMSDVCVPIAVSLGIVEWLQREQIRRPAIAGYGWMLAIVVCTASLLEVASARQRRFVPDAILQPRPTADSRLSPWQNVAAKKGEPKGVSVEAYFEDWKAMCYWVGQNTESDALFLTPRTQQTFKWYAERAEVATWKDIPQDAGSIVEWFDRLETLYPAEPPINDLIDHADAELIRLAQQYDAEYIVLDRSRNLRDVRLRRVYPEDASTKSLFAVYQVPLKLNGR